MRKFRGGKKLNIDFFDHYKCMNNKDPFTLEYVPNIKDPIILEFAPKTESCTNTEFLCVSLSSFEKFVHAQANAGRNIIGLEMNDVMCKDGRQRNFIVCKFVWIKSIWEGSRWGVLKNSTLRQYLSCAISREEQLKKLKMNDHLWDRVLFWVSDFLEGGLSEQERLNVPPKEGIAPFMTPYYFSKQEASYLGHQYMPNTTNLHGTLYSLVDDMAAKGAFEICTSHDIAPFLLTAFEIKKDFHKNQRFEKCKKQWLKNRAKEINIASFPSSMNV